MAYRETDPLLPNDRPAPEISGFGSPACAESAESPQHAYNSDEELTVVESAEAERQRSVNLHSLLLTAITVLVWAAILAAVIIPTRAIWRGRLTIEERVGRILSDTPLIG